MATITNLQTRETVAPRYLTCAETAALVRAALKAAFPRVKFSVRSDTYSGGASIRVNWTDGPTSAQVERVAKRFAGATFDGMVDLKSHHVSLLDGQPVHFGADFVFCTRKVSRDLLARAIRYAALRYGWDGIDAEASIGEYEQLQGAWTRERFGNYSKEDAVRQIAYTMHENGCIIRLKD